jgi:Flp pilus assembly protein TadD
MGVLLLERGELAESEGMLRLALQYDSNSTSIMNHLKEVKLKAGHPSMAETWFRRAIEHNPAVANYHWNRALALEALQGCAEARAEWNAW